MRSPEIIWTSQALFSAEDGVRRIGIAGPVTGIFKDYLIVAGGANFPDTMPWDGGKKIYYDSGNVYKISAESGLTKVGGFKMSIPLAYSACVSTPKGVVYAGGENGDGPTARVSMLKVDPITAGIVETVLASLPYEATNGSMTFDGNKLYFLGGEDGEMVHNKILSLDLNDLNSSWMVLDTLPKPFTNGFAGILSNSGSIELFVAGGRKKRPELESLIYDDVYRYHLASKVWKQCEPFPTSIAAGTIVNVEKHGVLLIGGDVGKYFKKTESLINAIAQETDVIKRQDLIDQRKKVQKTHPGFSNDVWLYQQDIDKWLKVGQVPFRTPVTATAVVFNRKVWIPSGEVRPGIRSDSILIGDLSSFY